jgi:4-phosphopantoate--beta-alanine ligase
VDLNPMSRTAQFANISIVDNFIRVMPLLISEVERLQKRDKVELEKIVSMFSNSKVLSDAMNVMKNRLGKLAEIGVFVELNTSM